MNWGFNPHIRCTEYELNKWVYLAKIGKKWLINKLESIETRNLGHHLKVQIHAKNQLDDIGYFDNKKHQVELQQL